MKKNSMILDKEEFDLLNEIETLEVTDQDNKQHELVLKILLVV